LLLEVVQDSLAVAGVVDIDLLSLILEEQLLPLLSLVLILPITPLMK
jgi:hypothetical protein